MAVPSEEYFVFVYTLNIVIPGRDEVASPESILTMVVMDSGPAASRRPGMTEKVALLPLGPLVERAQHGERHRGDAGADGRLRHRCKLRRVVGRQRRTAVAAAATRSGS